MSPGLIILLIQVAALQQPTSRDSSVTVRGVLEALDSRNQVMLVLDPPLSLGEGKRAFNVMLAGDLRRLRASDGHYVQVTGRLEGGGEGEAPLRTLRVERLRDADAAGAARRTVTRTFNEWIVATLIVVPTPVSWSDSVGRPTAITPVALFTLANLGRVELLVRLPARDLVCATVTPLGLADPTWRYAWTATEAAAELRVRIGASFRTVIPLPEEAARPAGRYTVRVTLCGLDDYAVEAPLTVGEP